MEMHHKWENLILVHKSHFEGKLMGVRNGRQWSYGPQERRRQSKNQTICLPPVGLVQRLKLSDLTFLVVMSSTARGASATSPWDHSLIAFAQSSKAMPTKF